MNREELENEIATLEQEIEASKQELEQVKADLGEAPLEEGEMEEERPTPVTEKPEEELTEDELALIQRKAELEEDILVKQSKLLALRKQLNDAVANESYNEEE